MRRTNGLSNMSETVTDGILDYEYAKRRGFKGYMRYRLRRRTREVLAAIEQFAGTPVHDIIDLGTADARMLDVIHQRYKDARCVGVEYNEELAGFAKANFPGLEIIRGDVQSLGFSDESFDVAAAAAVIEHVPNPVKMINEVKRVLRPGGIFILTTPDPFWERLAALVGHLEKGQHQTVMNLKQLSGLVSGCGFTVLKTQKFMLSPVGMPFEFAVEKIIRIFKLDFLMANQLLVARSSPLGGEDAR